MRVHLLYLEFLTEASPQSQILKLSDFLKSKGIEHRRIRINNGIRKSDDASVSLAEAYLEGDNTQREFSGWQKALHVYGREFEADDWIILANDTWDKPHNRRYFEFINWGDIQKAAIKRSVIAGIVDRSYHPLSLGDLTTDRWIRSCLVFIRWKDLKTLQPLNNLPVEAEEIFATSGPDLFRPGSHVHSSTKEWIESWLLHRYNAIPSMTEKWDKAAEEITDSNRLFFQGKATAILLEIRLSLIAQKNRIHFIDFKRARGRMSGIPWLLDHFGLFDAAQRINQNLNRLFRKKS